MKQITGFLAIFGIVLLFSCTKNKKVDHHGNNQPWGCYCEWHIVAGWHDTTIAFFYPQDTTQAQAMAACNARDAWAKSMAAVGSSGGYCRLY